MARIETTIMIDVPVEKVFEFTHPKNLPEIWPSLVEVKNVKDLASGGYSWDWVYKMAGMRFEGTSTHTEFVANERTVSESTGGIESTITWLFQPEGNRTKMTSVTDYKVPATLLGKLAENFIIRFNENESQTVLANLKARLEG
ncbi:MAG: SRPBCC family protein [Chloroflexota bacterium]|nr:MAG: SRPBCC family protein [Chloroflexota bacterium]